MPHGTWHCPYVRPFGQKSCWSRPERLDYMQCSLLRRPFVFVWWFLLVLFCSFTIREFQKISQQVISTHWGEKISPSKKQGRNLAEDLSGKPQNYPVIRSRWSPYTSWFPLNAVLSAAKYTEKFCRQRIFLLAAPLFIFLDANVAILMPWNYWFTWYYYFLFQVNAELVLMDLLKLIM